MGIIEIEKTYFFSSAVENGAQSINDNGSSFEVGLDTAISVPQGALDATIECRSCNLWFIMPNISASAYKNNRLYFKYDATVLSGGYSLLTPWDHLELPDGLYSVSDLNTCLRRLLSKKYIPGTSTRYSTTAITVSTNGATQRIIIEMDPGFILGTTPALVNNICSTLGIYHPNPLGVTFLHNNDYFEADSVANLTPINSFLLHSDIVENGLRVNNGVADILTEIQISAPPGSFLTYRPYLPYKLDGNHLKYSSRNRVRFYLTDQDNRPLDMFGESYSFSVVVKYKIDVSATMNTGYTQTFRHK